jgi:hypothetical protein
MDQSRMESFLLPPSYRTDENQLLLHEQDTHIVGQCWNVVKLSCAESNTQDRVASFSLLRLTSVLTKTTDSQNWVERSRGKFEWQSIVMELDCHHSIFQFAMNFIADPLLSSIIPLNSSSRHELFLAEILNPCLAKQFRPMAQMAGKKGSSRICRAGSQ